AAELRTVYTTVMRRSRGDVSPETVAPRMRDVGAESATAVSCQIRELSGRPLRAERRPLRSKKILPANLPASREIRSGTRAKNLPCSSLIIREKVCTRPPTPDPARRGRGRVGGE